MKNLLQNLSDAELASLLEKGQNLWENCICCPNKCGIDREKARPICGAEKEGIKVASFAVHDGEEPPVSGWNGAGNIFFSGCTLKCVYCQNWPISHDNNGRVYSYDEFKNEVLKLISKNVHNINLVTADHYLYPVLKTLSEIRTQINIPVVYNCSGYFDMEALKIVMKFADIFLYDVKYSDSEIAAKYSRFSRYMDVVWKGLDLLLEEQIPWIEDELGLLERGLIIRHLVIPEAIESSMQVLEKLAEYQQKGLVFKLSLMSQYFPAYKAHDFPEINRRLTEEEYSAVAERMESLGIDGWIQGF